MTKKITKNRLLEEAYDTYRSIVAYDQDVPEVLRSLAPLPTVKEVTFLGEKTMDSAMLEMQIGDDNSVIVGVTFDPQDEGPYWKVDIGRLIEVHKLFLEQFMDCLAATLHTEDIMDLRRWNNLPD